MFDGPEALNPFLVSKILKIVFGKRPSEEAVAQGLVPFGSDWKGVQRNKQAEWLSFKNFYFLYSFFFSSVLISRISRIHL